MGSTINKYMFTSKGLLERTLAGIFSEFCFLERKKLLQFLKFGAILKPTVLGIGQEVNKIFIKQVEFQNFESKSTEPRKLRLVKFRAIFS